MSSPLCNQTQKENLSSCFERGPEIARIGTQREAARTRFLCKCRLFEISQVSLDDRFAAQIDSPSFAPDGARKDRSEGRCLPLSGYCVVFIPFISALDIKNINDLILVTQYRLD